MEFKLITEKSISLIPNVTKVKGYLKSGEVVIFENHMQLLGLIFNNKVEIETSDDGSGRKNGNYCFALQDGVFIVSNVVLKNGLKKTFIYAYAKASCDINTEDSYAEILVRYREKQELLTCELKKSERTNVNKSILNPMKNSRILKLKEDVAFLQSSLKFAEAHDKS